MAAEYGWKLKDIIWDVSLPQLALLADARAERRKRELMEQAMALRAAFHADAFNWSRFCAQLSTAGPRQAGARAEPLSVAQMQQAGLIVQMGVADEKRQQQKELMAKMLAAGASEHQALRHAMVDMDPDVVTVQEVFALAHEMCAAEERDITLAEAREEALRRKRVRLEEMKCE